MMHALRARLAQQGLVFGFGTIQRFASTTKRCRSERRTISLLQCPVRASAAAI
jgi:hypothetical protein